MNQAQNFKQNPVQRCTNPSSNDEELSKTCRSKLVDGRLWKPKQASLWKLGYARTFRIRGSFRFSAAQKEFLNWAYQLGVKNKSQKR